MIGLPAMPHLRRRRPDHLSAQLDSVLPAFAPAAPTPGGGGRVVIGSVDEVDCAQTIAAQFAHNLASRGYSTLAIDANLQDPMLHTFFNVPNNGGLAALLASSDPPHRLLKRTADRNMAVLPAGSKGVQGYSLLTTEDIFHRVEPIAEKFDCMVADCTRLPAAIVATVARMADTIILLTQRNRTSMRKLTEFLDLLSAKETVEPAIVIVDA